MIVVAVALQYYFLLAQQNLMCSDIVGGPRQYHTSKTARWICEGATSTN